MLATFTLSFGVLLLGVVSCQTYEESGTVIIQTNDGPVKGAFGAISRANASRTLYWFRSIPFAEPPVGNLRFEAPVPKQKWSEVLDVRKKANNCTQGSNPVQGSEDCLYLGIYSGSAPSTSSNLPVMVWIYGGGYFEGNSDFEQYRPDDLLEEGVIIVAINYRVGFLGFLSTGDMVAPGNSALKDLILGLKWTKENIKNFGGDPDRITIWGQSAGAASVAYLLQTNQTAGLFNGAILDSGSSLCPWSLAKEVPEVTKQIARELKVDTTNSSTILAGLKGINITTLQTTASSKMLTQLIISNPLQGLVFAPVVEPQHPNAVITEKSYQLLAEGKFHQVPILMGYNSLEGYFDSLPELLRIWLAKYDVDNSQLVPDDMNLSPLHEILLFLGPKIKLEYFGLLSLIAASNGKLMRLIADTQFDKPIHEAIRLLSANTNVYAYHFSYEGPLWGRVNRTTDGVGHTEELGYLFDFGYKGSEADYLTRSRLVRLWTNFVKSWNPTPVADPLLQNIMWPPNSNVQSAGDLKYLEVNTNLSIVGLPNSKKMEFWNNLYKTYAKPTYSTY